MPAASVHHFIDQGWKKRDGEKNRFSWVGGVRENGGTNALRALLAVPGRWGGPSSSSLDDCESEEMFIVESCLGCETTMSVTSIGQGRGPFLLSMGGRVLPGNSSTEWIPSDDFESMASIGH